MKDWKPGDALLLPLLYGSSVGIYEGHGRMRVWDQKTQDFDAIRDVEWWGDVRLADLGDHRTPAMLRKWHLQSREPTHMVHVNSGGSVFVKERAFFVEQGGDSDNWGRAWYPIRANSVEDAREKGCVLLRDLGARPYSEQAKA